MMAPDSGALQAHDFESLQRAGIKQARDFGLATAELDTRLLLAHAAGLDEVGLVLCATESVSQNIIAKFEQLMARRLAGAPVSRLLGVREFYGLTFALCKDTLDPRPDSEVLVRQMVLKARTQNKPTPRFLDLGTGTGCLLLACLYELEAARGLGVDVCAGAVRQARLNASRLGLRARASFRQSDWFSALSARNEKADYILANPPYISASAFATLALEVRAHDPFRALVAGNHGLAAYEHIIAKASDYLTENGWIGCEVGAGQAAAVATLMRQNGFTQIETYPDLSNIDRVVFGQWKK